MLNTMEVSMFSSCLRKYEELKHNIYAFVVLMLKGLQLNFEFQQKVKESTFGHFAAVCYLHSRYVS